MRNMSKRAALCLTTASLLSFSLVGLAKTDDELTIFDWSGYEIPEFHPDYVAKHESSPTFTFFGDEEEAFQKLRSGFKTDLAHPCAQSVAKWRDAGLLEPLDTSKIAGWADMNPQIMAMKDLTTTADGKAWFLPWEWASSVLTYNTEKVDPADIKSLKSLADPKYKDRVSIGDSVDDAYALASLAIGVTDWTKLTDAQFVEASAFLREVHKNVRLYWTDSTEIVQAMSGGEVDLAWAWNDAAVQSALAGAPIKSTRDTVEGTSTWVCGYVRVKGATGSLDKAYDYLNAINTPAVAKYLLTDWGYGHANAKSMSEIDPAAVTAQGYGDVAKFLDKTLFQSPLPTDLRQKMIEEFEKIKAGY